MLRNKTAPALLLALSVFSVAPAGLGAKSSALTVFEPKTHSFSCRIPADWAAFEDSEPWGEAVHILGPEGPTGAYRTGIDIHRMESGKPGFVSLLRLIKHIRRTDAQTKRAVGAVQRLHAASGLARFVEVRESRYLPAETAPSREETLHHYIGFIEDGSGYFMIKLSASEEVYLDYREDFLELVKSFRPSS